MLLPQSCHHCSGNADNGRFASASGAVDAMATTKSLTAVKTAASVNAPSSAAANEWLLLLQLHVPQGVTSALEDNITITKELFLLVIQDQEVQSLGDIAGHQSDAAVAKSASSVCVRHDF